VSWIKCGILCNLFLYACFWKILCSFILCYNMYILKICKNVTVTVWVLQNLHILLLFWFWYPVYTFCRLIKKPQMCRHLKVCLYKVEKNRSVFSCLNICFDKGLFAFFRCEFITSYYVIREYQVTYLAKLTFLFRIVSKWLTRSLLSLML